jgi:hypothetical protein
MNTSQLLNEWKSFLLLNEHKVFSLKEIIEIMIQNGKDKKEVRYLRRFWNNNRFITKYTQVIQNELKNTQESIKEILDVCKLHYNKIYQAAGPKLKSQIGSGNISIDELRKQIDAKLSFNKNEVRQECQYRYGRPIVGKYQDFDVVYSEADYIVIEPKTIQGSIAWAHGKPDGSEETDQRRRVGWCTGVSSNNNMFPNYAGNLHMFYVINTDYDNDNSVNRRLCLSFKIKNGEPILNVENGSSVDAQNRKIKNVERIKSQKFYQDILQTLEGRKQTSFAEIYSKITVSQLKRAIAQMKRQNIDDNMIAEELCNYLKYASDKDVLEYLMQEENHGYEVVKSLLLSRKGMNLPFEEYSNLFQKAGFNSFVKDYYNENYDFEDMYERYDELFDFFDESSICKENPEGVYNLFKSIGIDLSDNRSIKLFINDLMGLGYMSLEEFFSDKPYLRPILGRYIKLNENKLSLYFKLM